MSDETKNKEEKSGESNETFGAINSIKHDEKAEKIVGAMGYVADRINSTALEVFLTAGKADYQKADEIARAYYKSNYCQAMAAAANDKFTGSLPDGWPFEGDFDSFYGIPPVYKFGYEKRPLEMAVVLYLAQHPNIDPIAPASLTESETKEIKQLAKLALALYKRGEEGDIFKQENGEIDYFSILASFLYAAVIGVQPKQGETPTKRAEAKRTGAMVDFPARALSITDKDYQHALTPYINKFAYIALLDADFFSKLSFEGGKLSYIGSDVGPAEVREAADNGRKTEIVKTLDIQLLRTIFTAIYNNAISVHGGNITVYLPAFCKAMGVDVQTGKANDIFGKINQFSTFLGYTDGGSFYKLLSFSKYDADANTITFDSPYMNMIIQKIQERNTITEKNGEQHLNPGYGYLVHTDIANERNKAAVEIVQIIVALLLQRGGKNFDSKGKRRKGEKVTGHKKFSAIVDEIPMLKDRIEGSDQSNINRQLSRAFKKAYELLKTKTDVYQYFVNLEIPDVVPTATTLKLILTYAHDGINPDYEQPK